MKRKQETKRVPKVRSTRKETNSIKLKLTLSNFNSNLQTYTYIYKLILNNDETQMCLNL